jgi:hypothetical protein
MHSIAVEDSPIRFFDSYIASDSATPVASAWHALARVERWMGGTRQLRVEAFIKRYSRLLESDLAQDPLVTGDEFLPTRGLAYGIDVFARQFETPGGRYSGWITYTYSVARREQAGFRFAPGHDRRHNLNVVTTMRAGKYVIGSRLGLASGTPYTEIVGQYVRRRFDPATNTWEYPGQPPYDVDYIGATRNAARYPLTHRSHLSLTRVLARSHDSPTVPDAGQCLQRKERVRLHPRIRYCTSDARDDFAIPDSSLGGGEHCVVRHGIAGGSLLSRRSWRWHLAASSAKRSLRRKERRR